MEFTGKTALVSGAVSGIGLGLARALAEEGVGVGMGYRNRGDFDAALESLSDLPREMFVPIPLDVTDKQAWADAVSAMANTFGRLDILANNAGTSFVGTIDRATQSDWDWIMGVNFGGMVRGVDAALPLIRGGGEGGHILNVTSMAAYLPAAEVGLYSTSKFAARGYTAALRQTLAKEGIGVSELAPGLTRSNIHRAATKRPATYADTEFAPDPELVEAFGQMMDLGMDPIEVGRKAVAGIRRNAPVIFSHAEFKDELHEAGEALIAAFPDEEVPAERMAIENRRRESMKHGGSLVSES